jgi:predicted RNA-binding protein associated with RNAse of E/G family
VGFTTDHVRIHYLRPPGRLEIFVQQIVERTDACIVTYLAHTELERPVVVRGQVVLEPGAPAVWFTFPDRWHDIGLFHLHDGVFTGTYANVLTPVRMLDERTWETTDLFLDVWQANGSDPEILDADELDHAVQSGWLDEALAERARIEAESVRLAALAGAWPPSIVSAWPLGRVLETIAALPPGHQPRRPV